MKTVPTVRLADTTDAVVLPDLPEEIQLAMADIAGARGCSPVIQVEVAFIRALEAEGLWDAADDRATTALVAALACGDRDTVDAAIDNGHRPLLLATSDNRPQMRSHSTREFLAGVAIAQQFGRPHTPTDQAWIGHVKGEWPHLEQIRDPAELEDELDRARLEYNTIRLHAGIGYVTPDGEHEGRGDAIRQNRRDGARRCARAPHRIPSKPNRGNPTSTPRSWLDISTGDWLINSDTAHLAGAWRRTCIWLKTPATTRGAGE